MEGITKEIIEDKMKAVLREKYGDQSVITVKDIPLPKVGPKDVLIRVHATTVNRTDCAILSGKPFVMRMFLGLFKPKQKILGTDFSGLIEQAGASVTQFSVGDRVLGFNDQGIGSQAEYLSLNAGKNVFKMPQGFTYQSAAASLEGSHYALNIINKVTIKAGQRVLINGATGAIGSALVQLCKSEGMMVTATCRGDHEYIVKQLGAEKVIDFLVEDFTQSNEKFDFVFDAVGKSTFGKCKRVLKQNGIYISTELGPGSQNVFLALFGLFKTGRKVIFPIPSRIDRSFDYINKLVERGEFNPLLDRAYSLMEAAEAYRYVMSGEKVGNVILEMNV